MYIARNADDHVELIRLALFEIEDQILCAEDEGEADAECPAVMSDLRTIDASHEALHTEILGRNCVIGRGEDLPCMPMVQGARKRLPIVALIDAVNKAHKKGFARD